MPELALVMPMAGRGSRFARAGQALPKPMIELHGRPFFWWAAESVLRPLAAAGRAPREIVAVVLEEHVAEHGIDAALRAHYPGAKVVVLPEVTEGAAETARIGIEALAADGPVAVQDCDHAFACPDLPELADALEGGLDAALMCFRADTPHFSYLRLDAAGAVSGTVEKQVASPFAIAGCYLFAGQGPFAEGLARFRDANPYDELFLSGVVDALARGGAGRVGFRELARHFPFGTPEEVARLDPLAMARALPWAAGPITGPITGASEGQAT
jgi:NDP-sugar pyrophosphorylase family protein